MALKQLDPELGCFNGLVTFEDGNVRSGGSQAGVWVGAVGGGWAEIDEFCEVREFLGCTCVGVCLCMGVWDGDQSVKL